MADYSTLFTTIILFNITNYGLNVNDRLIDNFVSWQPMFFDPVRIIRGQIGLESHRLLVVLQWYLTC